MDFGIVDVFAVPTWKLFTFKHLQSIKILSFLKDNHGHTLQRISLYYNDPGTQFCHGAQHGRSAQASLLTLFLQATTQPPTTTSNLQVYSTGDEYYPCELGHVTSLLPASVTLSVK